MSDKVLIGGLSSKIWSVVRLKDAFLPFGPIQDVSLGKEGRAVVVFKHASDAAEAVDNMDGAQIEDCTLIVELARTNVDNSTLALGTNQAVWGKTVEPSESS